VYLRIILEPATAVAAHLAGDVQVNVSQGGVNKELRALYDGTEKRIQKIERHTSQFMYVQFQCAEGKVFNNENARLAFEYCVDRKSIVDNVLDGDGELLNSVIPEPVWGYDPNIPPYEYNPEKAKEYLKKSNYDGRKIILTGHTSLKKGEDTMLAIADNMKAVGFNVDIEIIEMSVFFERRRTGNYDMFYNLALHSNNDAAECLRWHFYSGTDGHNFINKKMDSLIDQLGREMDKGKQSEYVSEISRIMREEAAPASGIYSANMTYYADWGVSGIYYFRDGGVRMMYVDYDPSQVPTQ
jgi:peptide/nickel transport system substrate-binding protein